MKTTGMSAFGPIGPRDGRSGARSGAERRQQGSALTVALMVLVVMTLLGLTALKSSALQQQMAANELVTNQAFQAAESGAMRTVREETFVDLAEDSTVIGSGSIGNDTPSPGEGVNEADFEAEAEHTSQSAPGRGSRQGIGSATVNSGCRKYHFEVVSEGSTDTTHAVAVVHQGLFRLICGGSSMYVQTGSG